MPFFFLLVDSLLVSIGCAVDVLAAGCAAFGSAAPVVPGELSKVSAVGCVAAGVLLPGVTVSTVAVLPVDGPPTIPKLGPDCGPKLSVSSPDSPEGVIVGGPL